MRRTFVEKQTALRREIKKKAVIERLTTDAPVATPTSGRGVEADVRVTKLRREGEPAASALPRTSAPHGEPVPAPSAVVSTATGSSLVAESAKNATESSGARLLAFFACFCHSPHSALLFS